MKILLVEDNWLICRTVSRLLTGQGYDVTCCHSLAEGRQARHSGAPWDLYLIDVMLPDGNGFDLCRKIREDEETPLLFLTSCDDEESIVKGLELGADDYITKPFGSAELLARIRANLRRQQVMARSRVLSCETLCLNQDQKTCSLDGKPLNLRPVEFELLAYMMQNPGIILKREQILAALWDADGQYIEDNTLSVHISRLREQLGQGQGYIETIRRVGYRFTGVVRRSN